jgi:hypothetical protein
MMEHTCNPSYSGGGGKFEETQAKVGRPCLKKNIQVRLCICELAQFSHFTMHTHVVPKIQFLLF